MTQSDISQIENGRRIIGRKIAKRIEQLFEVKYQGIKKRHIDIDNVPLECHKGVTKIDWVGNQMQHSVAE